MQNPHKWHFYLHYSCSIQNISLSLHPQFHAGDVCTSSAGVADIVKRRLLRSVLTPRNLANFKNNQDLATIDVLGMCISYALVPKMVACVCVHIGVGFALSVLLFWAMREPLRVERQQSDSTLFILCLYLT